MEYLLDFQKEEFEKGYKKIIENGLLFDYEYTEKFEKEFAKQFNHRYTIAMPSGTACITAIFKVLNLKYGVKKVLIPALTVKEVFQGIKMSGCEIKFMDVSKELPVSGKNEIKEGLKNGDIDAICYVHTGGLSLLNEIDISDDIILIEDCSHSHCIKELGKRGLASLYSFWTTKVLGGGTGMITTYDKDFYENLLCFVKHSKNTANYGYPFSVHEIPALMSYLDVKYWKKLISIRREQAELYHKNNIYSLQDEMEWEPIYYKFTITEKPPKDTVLTGYTHKPPLYPMKNALYWSKNHWNLYLYRNPNYNIIKNNVEVMKK